MPKGSKGYADPFIGAGMGALEDYANSDYDHEYAGADPFKAKEGRDFARGITDASRGIQDTLWGNDERPGLLGGVRAVGDGYDPNAGAFRTENTGFWQNQVGQGMQNAGSRQVGSYNATQQGNLIAQLQAMARGEGPSAAQDLLKQSTEQNVAQAAALGASQRGPGQAGAQYQIANQAAQANQQGAMNASILRSQEQMGAIGQLGNVLGQARGQDVATQQLNDQLTQFYMGQGMDLDKANQQAAAKLEELRMQNALKLEELRNQAYNGGDSGGGVIGTVLGMLA